MHAIKAKRSGEIFLIICLLVAILELAVSRKVTEGRLFTKSHQNKAEKNWVLKSFYQLLEQKAIQKGNGKPVFVQANLQNEDRLKRRKRNVADEIISGVYSRAKRTSDRHKILLKLIRLTKSMPGSCSTCSSSSEILSKHHCNIEGLLRHRENICPDGNCINKLCTRRNKHLLMQELKNEIFQLQKTILLNRRRQRRRQIKALLLARKRRLDPHSFFDGKQLISY